MIAAALYAGHPDGMKRHQWRSRGLITSRLAWGITQYWLIRNGPAGDVFPSWSPTSSDIERFCNGNVERFIRRRKAGKWAQKHLQNALASGQLAATYFDGEHSRAIPSWAWLSDGRVSFAWGEGRLPLDALLPEEWARWSGDPCFLQRRAFGEWLATNLPHLDEPPLEIVASVEKPPALITRRPLPERPYVELSAALSWLAFGISLNHEALWEVIQTARLCESIELAEKRLAEAVDLFADAVVAGQLRCVGKFAETYQHGEALLTDPIEPIRLMDYRRFDIVSNGLRFGKGLTTRISAGLVEILRGEGRKDMYRDVHVDRSDLLRRFPEVEATTNPLPPQPVKKPISDTKLLNWIRALGDRAEDMSQTELLSAVRAAFPDYHVARERVRAITSGRKRGRKPIRPESAA
jgi:hypothetical protein